MKILLAIPLLFVALTVSAQEDKSAEADAGTLLSELLHEVRDTLVSVDHAFGQQGLPPLKRATIHLKSALTKDEGGQVKIFFITLGKKVSAEAVQTLSIELTDPKSGSRGLLDEPPPPDMKISDVLAQMILLATTNVADADFGERDLELDKLTASVRFGLKSTGNGKLGIEVLPAVLEVAGGRNVAREEIQELILEFD